MDQLLASALFRRLSASVHFPTQAKPHWLRQDNLGWVDNCFRKFAVIFISFGVSKYLLLVSEAT